ncbi:MAG: hypothetical protein KDD45_04495, partial [Bdellovibrionales bacterium]|nr:hypothetical protein [Bdellovibrionales bacterium]
RAFFYFFPEIVNTLKVLRITGGEPLLSQHFWNLLEKLETNKNNLNLIINSHLCHNENIINKFVHAIENLKIENKISNCDLYVSLDTYGDQAEYIRAGLDYKKVITNIKRIKQALPDISIVIMCTYNLLSISRFKLFLDDIIELKKNFSITLDMSYLRDPQYLRADITSKELKKISLENFQYMKTNDLYFDEHEISKFKNIIDWTEREKPSLNKLKIKSDLFRFISEFDKRKRKKFIQIFPEYSDYLFDCKKSAMDFIFGDKQI